MNKLLTKKDFEEVYFSGGLGNKLRSWQSAAELLASDYKGTVTARSRVANSKNVRYNVGMEEVKDFGDEFYFNESAPDENLLIQGEFLHDAYHNRYLMYSDEKIKMRKFLKLPSDKIKTSEGTTTYIILNTLMSPNSWEDFRILEAEYFGHVIEFGIYNHYLGDCLGRNTIIWEVRSY